MPAAATTALIGSTGGISRNAAGGTDFGATADGKLGESIWCG